jgi:hypothetical protein
MGRGVVLKRAEKKKEKTKKFPPKKINWERNQEKQRGK